MAMKLTAEQFEDLVDCLLDEGVVSEGSDGAVRGTYSGRGMYGATCLSVTVGGAGAMLVLGVALAKFSQGNDLGTEWISAARQDSMGYDTVVYWPQVTVEDGPDGE